MKELSLNVLDIAENSYKAGATLTEITISEDGARLTLTVRDNGRGMHGDAVRSAADPFYTTRKTRSVGLGLPLLKSEAEQTGGEFKIESRHIDDFPNGHGTTVTAIFYTDHIDCPPIGDIASTVSALIQGHPNTETVFKHKLKNGNTVYIDTREMRAVLGDIPLDTFDVLEWVKSTLKEQYFEYQ